MSLSIELDARQVDELAGFWSRSPDITAHELMAATTEAGALLEREIKELTPVGATGLLRSSIGAQLPRRLGDSVVGVVGTSLAHAVPVELGTRPHFPPLQPLEDWVRAKLGISNERQVTGVAFAIARKIAARGTIGVGMFHRAFASNKAQVEAMYGEALHRIRRRLAGGGNG